MKCPHCDEEIVGDTCSACHGELPAGSRYCCWCGEALTGSVSAPATHEQASADDDEGSIDFAGRLLCSDGTCIGVIGPDGCCRECGEPYTGEPEEG